MTPRFPLVLLFFQLLSITEPAKVIRAAPEDSTTGNYVIVLSEGTSQRRFREIEEGVKNSGSVIYTKVNGDYAKIISANLSDNALEKFSEFEDVEFIEEETYATASSEVSWALDRINQQNNKKLDGFTNSNGDGQGVAIYILDSGINYEQCEFGGRAVFSGYDPVDKIMGTNYEGRDCSGHGTHTASIAAGASSGVASKAKVYSVRVLDCDNHMPWSAVIDGLNHVGEKIAKAGMNPSVILLALSGPVSLGIDHTLEKLLNQNIPIVGAGGNHRGDACSKSPSSTPGVITVSASSNHDEASPTTNAGPCIDLFAPGVSVVGANYSCTGCDCKSIHSGTSVSSALVAGVVSLYLQESPRLTPSEVRDKLLNTCTRNTLHFDSLPHHLSGVTNNCLLYINTTIKMGDNSALDPTNVVATKTVTVSIQASPTPETVCCQMVKNFESFELSLGNIVEREMYKAAQMLQSNITSLFTSNSTQPPVAPLDKPDDNNVVMRKSLRQKTYIHGTAMKSCKDLTHYGPLDSNYYPVIMQTGDEAMVYCDLDKEIMGERGFMRMASINMSDPNTDCPDGLSLRTDGNLRTCQRNQHESGCSSTYFSSSEVEYSRVCGRIRGYQWASPNAFYFSYKNKMKILPMIDEAFVDGVILTYKEGESRKHIWTFAAATDEIDRSQSYGCPCTNTYSRASSAIPAFVGNDYFCETGSRSTFKYKTFYTADPLWDGKGCGEVSTCCDKGEWFCKDVPKTSSDIELRLCGNEPRQNEDTPLELIEIFVQ